jgi:hypothetical protein
MSSRKEQKEALRQERLAREQQAAQAAARKRLIGIVVAAVLALGIVGALAAVLLAGGDDDSGGGSSGGGGDAAKVSYPDGGKLPDQKEADLDAAVEKSGCTVEDHDAGQSGQHTSDPVNYKTEPPAFGPHNPVPEEDKRFDEAPQTERVVHALEHGRVVVWVRPDDSPELLGQLKALYDEDPYHVLMVPRKELKEPVAVSAWSNDAKGHILRCAEPNDRMWDAIRAFKEKYRDKGPEFVP